MSQSGKRLHQKSSPTVLRTAYQRKQQIHYPLTYLVLQMKILELQILLHETGECAYSSAYSQQRAGVCGVVYLNLVKFINLQKYVIFNGSQYTSSLTG